MNAMDITRKLSIVEKDPRILWSALEYNFGYGYFNSVIEQEFGISPDFKDYINKQYSQEMNNAKNEMLS